MDEKSSQQQKNQGNNKKNQLLYFLLKKSHTRPGREGNAIDLNFARKKTNVKKQRKILVSLETPFSLSLRLSAEQEERTIYFQSIKSKKEDHDEDEEC